MLGSNISGTFASIISILTGLFASSVRTAAIYYFITAMFVILLCFDTYFALPLNVSRLFFYLKKDSLNMLFIYILEILSLS